MAPLLYHHHHHHQPRMRYGNVKRGIRHRRHAVPSRHAGAAAVFTAADSSSDDDDDLPLIRIQKPSTLHYTGDISQPSATKFAIALASLDASLTTASSTASIEIRLFSHGGDLYAGLAMHESVLQVRANGRRVVVVGVGIIASAATFVLMAATQKRMTRTCVMLIHQLRCSIWGESKASDVIQESRNVETEMKIMKTLYMHNSRIAEAELDLLLSSETNLTYDEALRLGLIDDDGDGDGGVARRVGGTGGGGGGDASIVSGGKRTRTVSSAASR